MVCGQKLSGHNPLRSKLHRWTKSPSWFCKSGQKPLRDFAMGYKIPFMILKLKINKGVE